MDKIILIPDVDSCIEKNALRLEGDRRRALASGIGLSFRECRVYAEQYFGDKTKYFNYIQHYCRILSPGDSEIIYGKYNFDDYVTGGILTQTS